MRQRFILLFLCTTTSILPMENIDKDVILKGLLLSANACVIAREAALDDQIDS